MHIPKLALLGWAYVAAIAAWLLGRALGLDRLWWFALIGDVALYLFLPLLLLLPFALIQGRPALLLGLLLPGGVFLWLFGGLLLPKAPAPLPPGASQITAMSLNKLWSNGAIERIAAAIDRESPDVVGMQEVTPQDMRALRAALARRYPYDAYQQPVDPGDVHGSALFSRYPIRRVAFRQSVTTPDIVADLEVQGRPLTVIVDHLAQSNVLRYPWRRLAAYAGRMLSLRDRQVDALVRQAERRGAPLLILCDCNLSSTSRLYARLAGVLGDSFAEAGWGLGNTARLAPLPIAVMRIDYIWHSAELTPRAAQVGPDVGSDHLPVIATLLWR